MPKNTRERDQIWNCPTNPVPSDDDNRPAAISPDQGLNVPAPFPGLVTKFLDRTNAPVYRPGETPPIDPDNPPPPIVPPPVTPPDYPDPPPEFLDGYWEVFHTYDPGVASASLDGGHNWEPVSIWDQNDAYEEVIVFGENFDNIDAGQSLSGHQSSFGSSGDWT